MYALVETVTITDFERARQELQQMLPNIKETPGFVGGYWLAPTDGTGMSVTVYENEDAANAVRAQMQPGTKLNDYVTVTSAEVREVVANL
jgi:heme-degrading monooxygenase HmoA